jgi:peptidoglycan/xylan/chitin deacetylase (PgdA/CDA1 family)
MALAPAATVLAAEVVAHGPRDQKRIALTFDACTTRDVSRYDDRVTRELEAAHVPATIFLGGGWAHTDAAHARRLAENPLFELGNHSYSHPHLRSVSADKIREELQSTQDEIKRITGKTPRLFRPPYGEYDERVVRVAAEVGLTTVEYDLPSGDPDQHATKDRLVEWVVKKARPGSIVVFHINHTRFHTAEALPEIVERLRKQGYEFVTVSELIDASHGHRGEEAP